MKHNTRTERVYNEATGWYEWENAGSQGKVCIFTHDSEREGRNQVSETAAKGLTLSVVRAKCRQPVQPNWQPISL